VKTVNPLTPQSHEGGVTRFEIDIPDDLDVRFRKTAAQRLGMRKGTLSKAGVLALEEWIIGHWPEDEGKHHDTKGKRG